jgi:hypothetical protein
MEATRNKVHGMVDDMAAKAHQTTDAAAQQIHHATDVVAETVHHGADKAANIAGTVGATAHDATAAVGHAKDAVAQWATDVANHPGDYIKAGGSELAGLIQRHPISALCVGIGIGFALARITLPNGSHA